MKVLIGHFTTESNEHVPNLCKLENYEIRTGEDLIQKMQVGDLFDEANIELIPAIYANGYASGCVDKKAFDYILSQFEETAKTHLNELDGMFLFLHGASKVEGQDESSGEHVILKRMREIVGEYLPIAVVMDPHGNLSQGFVDQATILRCYRESPHTDMYQTYRQVAKMLIDLLSHRRYIKPVYRKLNMILGGEKSVSTDEPMLTINHKLNEVETSPRILSASFHVGYLRHDDAYVGCSVVVVPNSEEDMDYANQVADELKDYIFGKRHEFHYNGLALDPHEANQKALEFVGSPVFITDSGDNTTSGATGANTLVLRQWMDLSGKHKKKILFAAITDARATQELVSKDLGQIVEFELGENYDELSSPVFLKARIKKKGYIENLLGGTDNIGDCVLVSLEEYPIDILVTQNNVSYAELHQYKAAEIDLSEYDIVIVKQGYIFPEIKAISKLSIMSLTPGATNQKSESIPFKRIRRPMFPIDSI